MPLAFTLVGDKFGSKLTVLQADSQNLQQLFAKLLAVVLLILF
jgi:hypothetical protein